MNILLVCAAGMSTSLLVADMRKHAAEGTKIEAIGESNLENEINNYDVILVGPQLRFKLKKLEAIAKPLGKPIAPIDPVAYGRMDGNKVYQFAKELYQQK